MSLRRKQTPGFTLIELMLVVAIVAVLASMAIPQLGTTLTKSQEGVTKGNLGALRSALSIYYSDNEGTYPTNFNVLTQNSRYVGGIPAAYYPAHQ